MDELVTRRIRCTPENAAEFAQTVKEWPELHALAKNLHAQGLLPGLRMRGDIQFGKVEGWLIPRSALVKSGDGFGAFQVAGGKAARVAVQVLTEQGEQAVVKAAFDSERRLVTVGAYQLSDGMAVREAKS